MIAPAQQEFQTLTKRMLKSDKLRSFYAFVTVEMAQWIIDNLNTHNRPLRASEIHRHTAAMTNGQWAILPQGLIFANDVLLDGQHRLYAIVKSGIPQVMLISVGCDKDILSVLDTGKRRTIHDCLALTDRHLSAFRESIVRALHRKNRNEFCADFIWNKYLERKDGIEFSVKNIGHVCSAKGVANSLSCSCVALAYYREPTDRLTEFCECLLHGFCRADHDIAAHKVRDWLTKQPLGGEQNRDIVIPKIRSAIYQFCRYDTSKRITIRHGLYEDVLETASA